jgi:hypothetical protein
MLQQEWHSFGVGMGYRYDTSPVVVPDGTPPTPDDPGEYLPTARPGHRAPHAWLADGRSTLDLFGDGFTLLRLGFPGDVRPLADAAEAIGMRLRVVSIDDPAIARLYERSLVLVRPDGMVAWRGDALPGDVAALVAKLSGRVKQAI